jgi:hypothetical protein
VGLGARLRVSLSEFETPAVFRVSFQQPPVQKNYVESKKLAKDEDEDEDSFIVQMLKFLFDF